MRDCPVCRCVTKKSTWSMEYKVPEGWGLPEKNLICVCDNCSMIYYDNDKEQSDYDNYYSKFYDSDLTLVGDLTHKRLEGLAKFILEHEKDVHVHVVDFGGGEGYLGKFLSGFGYDNVETVNVGDKLPDKIDLLVCSHVLEHVYDLRGTMDKLTKATWGRILIDVPDASEMAGIKTLPILDYHQKHINHFTIRTMNLLLDQYGYSPTAIETYTVETHNYPSFRILYDVMDEHAIYEWSKSIVKENVEEKVRKLKEIDEPVIVYGCGDICLHILTQVNLDIIHYVDNDPAFIGHPINGIEVLDHIEGDYPIVIITQMQTELILERIKKLGITNKVIVI